LKQPSKVESLIINVYFAAKLPYSSFENAKGERKRILSQPSEKHIEMEKRILLKVEELSQIDANSGRLDNIMQLRERRIIPKLIVFVNA